MLASFFGLVTTGTVPSGAHWASLFEDGCVGTRAEKVVSTDILLFVLKAYGRLGATTGRGLISY
jgi:hypothetical protein